MKKNFVRIFALVLAAVLVLGVVSMGIVAMAAAPDTLYFKPNTDWKDAGARFAAYFFGNGDTWVSMTDSDGDGIYECAVPGAYTNVIFCRMNPDTTENNWNDGVKWNQTVDLTIPTDGKNCFSITTSWNGENKGEGSWSTIEVDDNTCEHVMDFGSITTAATCTTAGVTTYTCTLCGYTKTEAIPALGHSFVDGTCSVCGAVETKDRVIYFVNTDNWSTVNAYAWNTDTNEKFLGTWPGSAMTLVEGNLYSITVSGDATHIIFNNGSAQTADLELSTEYNCYDYANGWDLIVACDHAYNDGVVTTAPTCTEDGVKTYTCGECGHTYTEAIAALGHMYSDGTCLLCGEAEPCSHLWDNGSTTTAATCTTDGVKTYTCRKCGETKTETIKATGHKYLDGVCYNCGEKEPVIEYIDIATAADLIAFANRVNAGENALNGRLVANIDLKGATWTPIGYYCAGGDANKSLFYRGIFNGNGYTVSNFTVAGDDSVGLFGYTEMGTIKNLGVINATATGANAGAIVGYNATATIINCFAMNCTITGYTTNAIALNSRRVYVGAVAGQGSGYVYNCYAVNCTIIDKTGDMPVPDDYPDQIVTELGEVIILPPYYDFYSAPVGGNGSNISNNYYHNVSGTFYSTAGATEVTAAQLSSGEVAYKLQGSQTEAVWGQEIGKDAYPVIFGKSVAYENGTYVNKDEVVCNHNYVSSVTAPTCTSTGYTTHTCSKCGDEYVTDVVSALGHTWTDATCTAPKTCSVCGETEGEALGHASYTYSYDKTNGVHNFTCTLCGETVTKTAEAKFGFNTAAPALSVNIVMNIATTLPTGFSDPYMVIEFNGKTTTLTNYTINATNGRYEYAFPGINPQTMGDTFVATLYAKYEGVDVSVDLEYSMIKYINSQLKKSISNELRTALSDLVMYGEANQVYEGYKTDALLSTLLESTATLTPSTFPGLDDSFNQQATNGTKDANIDLKGVSMVLGSKVIVRMTLQCADASAYSVKVNIGELEYTYAVSDLKLADGYTDRYVVEFDQIKATQFGDVITFSFVDASGNAVGHTLTYSVYTYVQKNQASTDENLVNLLEAIYNYGEAVKNI